MEEIIQISKEVIEELHALAEAAFKWRMIEDDKLNLSSTINLSPTTETVVMPQMM